MPYLLAILVGVSEFAVSTHCVVTIKTNTERFVQTAKSAVLIVVVVSVCLISFMSS